MIRIGVTGTDTGVGKTVIAAALLALLRRRGLRVAGMKPVETGAAERDPESDAALLRAAAETEDSIASIRPILLAEYLAPWVAAERAGTPVELTALDAAFHRLSADRNAVVVEGAGGLLVPFTREMAFDGLAVAWELDLVVVAANRLGAINHTLLTVRAAHDAGLRVRGVVLNASSAAGGGLAAETNPDALRELLVPVPVFAFPWLTDPRDLGVLAATAEEHGLGALVEERRKRKA
ncbi:MAG: dethiobiotin synthase [Gemmatimonadota bacterium]|nr:dethiobiotin synthase [Gemmatimonadota bacterium]